MAAIICGINDSAGARDALRVAAALSAHFNTRLVLAHIAESWSSADDQARDVDDPRQGGARLLERAAREHHVHAESRVEVGEPAEGLSRIASEEAASVIIVGSRRKSSIRRRRRTHFSNDLAALAPCPVVVVPPGPRR